MKYEQERGKIIEELRKTTIQGLNFKLLIIWASEVNSKAFYDFIRETGLLNIIQNSVPHSRAEGGGNAPIYVGCQPLLKTKKKKTFTVLSQGYMLSVCFSTHWLDPSHSFDVFHPLSIRQGKDKDLLFQKFVELQ